MNILYSNTPTARQDNRSLHRVMVEINNNLAAIHKKMSMQIDLRKYAGATNYVSQFIPYTTIWNVKFTYNLESPEVALMQIMHLEYIFDHEDASLFTIERASLAEMKALFHAYNPYSEKLLKTRQQRFLDFIHNSQ